MHLETLPRAQLWEWLNATLLCSNIRTSTLEGVAVKQLMMNPTPLALSPVAGYFKVLSEVSRLQVLCCLRTGAKNVTEIVEATGLGQANVSKHLKVLMQAGIVSRHPEGISVYYQISDPMIFRLCELVYDRLQTQQMDQLKLLREGKPVFSMSDQ